MLLPGLYICGLCDCQSRLLINFGKNRIVFFGSFISLIIHIVVSYILINKLGLGVYGTGYAAIISFSCRLMLLMMLTLREKDILDTCFWPDKRTFMCLMDYIKIGLPSTFMLCLDWWAWEMMLMFSGYFGIT